MADGAAGRVRRRAAAHDARRSGAARRGRVRHPARAAAALALGTVLGLVVSACGDDGGGDGGSGSGLGSDDAAGLADVVEIDGPEAEVNVLDNTFNEENIRVQVGTRVVWTNNGRQDHDIVPADDGAGFGVGRESFQPGDVYEHTFDEPGTYRYYCSLHGTESAGMIGAIVVEGGGAGDTEDTDDTDDEGEDDQG